MKFPKKTTEEIRLNILRKLNVGNIDTTRGSYIDSMVSAVSSEIASLYLAMNVLLAKTDPDLMDDDSLALNAAQHGMYPLKATKTILEICCPAEKPSIEDYCSILGSQFKITKQDITKLNTYVAESMNTGNIKITINTPVSFEKGIPLPPSQTSYVQSIIEQGRDDETTSELRSRYKGIIGASIANNPLWFKNEALSVSGVHYAKVVRSHDTAPFKKVGIYAGTSDFKAVSPEIVQKLTNHFRDNALIGTEFECNSILNTDDWKWTVKYSSNTFIQYDENILKDHIFTYINDFLKNYNLKISPGTEPILNLVEISGYLLTQMYDTSFNVINATIAVTDTTGKSLQQIELKDRLVVTINKDKLTIQKG